MDNVLQELQMDKQTESVKISFGIRSDELNPSEISNELEIIPSWSFAKGEKYMGRRLNPETKELVYVQQKRPWGIWAIDTSSLGNIRDVHDHIYYLLNLLEPKKEKIKNYLAQTEKYQIGFIINWSPIGGFFGSYEINSQILLRMSELSHYIEFSFLRKTGE